LIKVTLPDGKIVNVIGSRSLLNGSNSNYSVEGYVPFSYLPHVIDPSRGFAFAPNQPTVWENYPYPFIGGFWSSGGRAMSIYKFLESHKMNISDTIALQSNLTDSWAGMLTPILMKYLETSNLSTTEIQALQYLSEWNHTAYEDSIGMTIYWYTISFIYNDTFYRSFNENNVTFLPLPFITSIIYAFEYGKFNFDGYNTSTLIPLAFKQALTI
jgi:Protein related to penicillin acylase